MSFLRPALVDRFLSAYDALDNLMRGQLRREPGESHVALLHHMKSSNGVIRANFDTLRRFAELRNLLQHDADRNRWPALAVPDQRVVELYEKLVHDVRHEPTALDRCIRRDNLFVAGPADRVVEVMRTMAKRGYSQAPVLEQGTVIGVFSESTPFAMAASETEQGILIADDMTLKECELFLGLDRQVNEAFAFVARTAPWSKVEEIFAVNRQSARRLGAVFVTETGKASEKLLGMITAWDLA